MPGSLSAIANLATLRPRKHTAWVGIWEEERMLSDIRGGTPPSWRLLTGFLTMPFHCSENKAQVSIALTGVEALRLPVSMNEGG